MTYEEYCARFARSRPGEKDWHRNEWGCDAVYVVAWPLLGIVKAGRSKLSRWVTFQDRGAVCLLVSPYSTKRDCMDVEAIYLAAFEYLRPRAFDGPCELAEQILGRKSAGWSECFSMSFADVMRYMTGQPIARNA